MDKYISKDEYVRISQIASALHNYKITTNNANTKENEFFFNTSIRANLDRNNHDIILGTQLACPQNDFVKELVFIILKGSYYLYDKNKQKFEEMKDFIGVFDDEIPEDKNNKNKQMVIFLKEGFSIPEAIHEITHAFDYWSDRDKYYDDYEKKSKKIRPDNIPNKKGICYWLSIANYYTNIQTEKRAFTYQAISDNPQTRTKLENLKSNLIFIKNNIPDLINNEEGSLSVFTKLSLTGFFDLLGYETCPLEKYIGMAVDFYLEKLNYIIKTIEDAI